MTKIAVAVGLSLMASVAWAQCSQTVTVSVSENGKPFSKAGSSLFDVTKAEAEDLSRRGRSIIDEASKVQDKGGPYTVEINEERACDGAAARPVQGVMVQGVTFAGANRIARQAIKVGGEIVGKYEGREKAGKKHPWKD
jgi:hypothetical protein